MAGIDSEHVDLSIDEIQGPGIRSQYAGTRVTTRGIVTGHARKGFFIQRPASERGDASAGIFVYSPNLKLSVGNRVEVVGTVVDYCASPHDKPTTQIQLDRGFVLGKSTDQIAVAWIGVGLASAEIGAAAAYLNRLEGMLVGIKRGATFVAPSNPFGDYVAVPEDWPGTRTDAGGLLIDPRHPMRWLPSFRVLDYANAPRVDVGSLLESDVIGPLNYRANAFQIAALKPPVVSRFRNPDFPPTSLERQQDCVTVMTVNGFNLDPHVESKRRVADPARDVDDDRGRGRFRRLAQAIVDRGQCPDVIALQEIQDADGAEQTAVNDAEKTFLVLAGAIRAAGGPNYAWADVPPEIGADGGQPGGNIRNGFLYDSSTLEIVDGTLARFGVGVKAFESSRKPLIATFRCRSVPHWSLTIINVHLSSKRQQRGVFAPEHPGFDPQHERRVSQGQLIAEQLAELGDADYYVTGDFNDYEFSDTLRAVCGQHAVNMVDQLPATTRYDYNHRGQSLVLMHGVVSKRQADEGRVEYEVLHGNELIGVTPGDAIEKASDHAYVIARFTSKPE